MHIVKFSLLSLIAALLSPLAMAQADCSKEIGAIEERIESGTYSEESVQLARQLQASFGQMCAFMDEDSKAKFVEQIDEFLPAILDENLRSEHEGPSEAEKQANRDARQSRKAAAQAEVLLDPVLQAAPTARIDSGQFVDRPDPMTHLSILDWDNFGGKLRILYITNPDRNQSSGPNWKNYIYVAEVAADGTATQHLVTSKQENLIFGAIALRAGHDEILLHRRNDNDGNVGTLERWSISGERQISSVPAPNPVWPDGKSTDWGKFRVATSDGNVVFSQTKSGQRGEPFTAAWFEASPDGRVLGMGSMSDSRHDYRVPNWFPTRNGGGGIVLTVRPAKGTGTSIVTDIATPIRREIGGRKIHATVVSETRLLVTNDNANTAWESAAIERNMSWGGDLAMPANLSAQQSIEQSNEYRQLTDTVANAHDANRKLSVNHEGSYSLAMIKPMKDGYGLLADVTANRSLTPPIHGPYFLSVDNAGVHKRAYLEPYAEQLDVKFTMLGISTNDDVYLYGFPEGSVDDSTVMLLDTTGKPKAYGRIPKGRKITMDGLFGDSKGAWVIGRAYRDGEPAKVWIGRVEFP
jgi:hypothetical protein